MKKKSFLIFLTCFVYFYGNSQHLSPCLLSTDGGISENESIILEWSLGESFIETVSSNAILITQGYHQPSIQSETLVSELSNPVNGFEMIVMPNPASTFLFVNISNPDLLKTEIKLYDISGRMIQTVSNFNADSRIEFDVSELVSGIYLMHVTTSDGLFLASQKVVVTN